MTMVRELAPGDTVLAHRALCALRPDAAHLATREAFTSWVDTCQRPEGYRVLASFAPGVEEAVAVAGFRHQHTLAWGHYLYIDDLITLPPFRGQGHAHALMIWLLDEARRLGCTQVHLDSGVHRHTAHRFYLNHRFAITSHHFALVLSDV